MAADLVLLFPCEVKRSLGAGDLDAGTDQLLRCLKARDRAALIAETYSERGETPEGKSIELMLLNVESGNQTRQVPYEEFLAEAAPLLPLESHCLGCPANFRGRSFGCIGVLNYPVTLAAQQWLLDRLEPSATVGGQFFLRMCADFGYTGEPLQGYREANLIEGKQPLTRPLSLGGGQHRLVTIDQIFHGILCLKEPLGPAHCFLVLLWLGAVRFEGVPISTVEQLRAAVDLKTVAERQQRVTLDIGPADADHGIRRMQGLLEALYASFILDTPLWVWS